MKKRSIFLKPLALLFAVIATTMTACGQSKQNDTSNNPKNMETTKIKLTVTATLADNSSAEALRELIMKGDLTIEMEDYASMEKVGPIGTSLPRNDRPTTTSAGDIILYQGKYLVIYYDKNSWNFTRLGRIDNATADELKQALGSGDVTVTLSAE